MHTTVSIYSFTQWLRAILILGLFALMFPLASSRPVYALNNVTLSDNTAMSGGGINNVEGTVTLNNTTVSRNTAGIGGGVANTGGMVTVTNSTISGNRATSYPLDEDMPDRYGGGGIFNQSSGTLIVRNSIVSENSAHNGGGIYTMDDHLNSAPSVLRVINSTISGNRARQNGGGIYDLSIITSVDSGMAITELYNATIAQNTADDNQDLQGAGGGIFNDAGRVTLRNSILAGNTRRMVLASADDCNGAIAEAFNTLIQTMKGCSFSGPSGRNKLNIDPKLAPLAANGGPTHSHALLSGSPAIDAGDQQGCRDDQGQVLTIDQRGALRPLDGDGDLVERCDMGAYEAGIDSTGAATTQAAPQPANANLVYLPMLLKAPTASLANGDFEAGRTIWTELSARSAYPIISKNFPAGVAPHSGQYAAWLGGVKNEISSVQQQVNVPAASPYLVYWHWIASSDYCGYDFGKVMINNTAVASYDLCADMATGGWVKRVVNLSAYAGKSVALRIEATTDFSRNSSLFIDDVTFQAGPGLADEHVPDASVEAGEQQLAAPATAEKPALEVGGPEAPYAAPKLGYEE